MWSRLDHAAKLYASMGKDSNTATFRLSATLTERIDPEVLQKATDQTMNRYAKFRVHLAKGIFWSFLSRNTNSLVVEREWDYPCYPIRAKGPTSHLIRVLYFENRVSVEFFHALTDGTGGLSFLKTLVMAYLGLQGHVIHTEGLMISPDGLPHTGEDSDAFVDFQSEWLEHINPQRRFAQKARGVYGTAFDPYGHNVVEAILSSDALKTVAKEYGVSVTTLLLAATLKALANTDQKPDDRRFVIAVPVNLRKAFLSNTLRNFFIVVNIGETIDAKADFREIVLGVENEMAEKLTRESLAETVADTMHFDNNLPSRMLPNFLKRFAIRFGFQHFSQPATSMTLSNLGEVQIPPEMEPFVERIGFVLYPDSGSPINVAVVACNGLATISFARSIVEADFVLNYVNLLNDLVEGDIVVSSNEWGM